MKFYLVVTDPRSESKIVLATLDNSFDAQELFETVYLWMDMDLQLDLFLGDSEEAIQSSVGR